MISQDTHDLIILISSQLLVLGTGMITTYFKLKNKFFEKVSEVKHHTETSLHKLNGMLSYVIASFDRPAWIKVASTRPDGSVEFRMLDINEAYCNEYNISRSDYIGKTDLEVGWDMKTAKKFREHDLQVWASGEPTTFVECVDGKCVRFRKFRIASPSGETKGIFGYAVECSDPSSCKFWNPNGDKKCLNCGSKEPDETEEIF